MNDETHSPAAYRGEKRGPDARATAAGASRVPTPESNLIATVWRGRWFVLAAAILFGTVGVYHAFSAAVPKFAATAEMTFQVRQQQVLDFQNVVPSLTSDQPAINTELRILQSGEIVRQLVEDRGLVNDAEFNPYLRDPGPFSRAAVSQTIRSLLGSDIERRDPTDAEQLWSTVAAVRASIGASGVRSTFAFNVRFTSESPAKAIEYANRLAEIYVQDQVQQKFDATEYASNWLSDRVASLEPQLLAQQEEISRLKTDSGILSIEELEAANVQVRNLKSRLDARERRNASQQNTIDAFRDVMTTGDMEQIAATFGDSRLDDLLTGGEGARERFMSLAGAVVASLERTLSRDLEQTRLLQDSYNGAVGNLAEINETSNKLIQLTREAEATRILYENFLTRLRETTAQAGLQQADSRIITPATFARQVEPRRLRLVALYTILGALVGAGLVLLRESRASTFRTGESLEQTTGYRVFGEIPRMPIRKRKQLLGHLNDNPTSVSVEAIRNLRTSVLFSDLSKPPQFICYTSALPGEGKTTLAISHAHNLGLMGKKVLLIEGDLRRRTLENYMEGLDPAHSILTVMSGKVSLAEAVTAPPGMMCDVLGGEHLKANAADIFSSSEFDTVIEQARQIYDVIIIDTPPVLVVTDSRIITQHSDMTIMVVKWDSTQRTQVIEALRQLEIVGAPVDGVVLSQISPKGMRRYGYYGTYGNYDGYLSKGK